MAARAKRMRAPDRPGETDDQETPLARLSLDDVRDIASANAFARGQNYWRQGAVVALSVERDGLLLKGRVQGSEPRPYSQTITLDATKSGYAAIAGECSCPVGLDCKHVVAVLLAAMARRSAVGAAHDFSANTGRDRLEDVAVLLSNTLKRAESELRRGEALAPDLRAWIDALAATDQSESEDYPAEVRQRLVYLLTIDRPAVGPGLLCAQPLSARLRSDGSFAEKASPYNTLSIFNEQVAKFVRPSDRQILKRLHRMRNSLDAPQLSGEEGAAALAAMIATGRARWESVNGPVVALGAPRQGRIVWRLAEDASLRLDVEIAGGEDGVRVANLAPPWYVDARTATAGPIETGQAPRVAEKLLSAPPAPYRQAPLLRAALGARFPHFEAIEPPDLPAAEIVKEKPVPVLRLAARDLPSAYSSWDNRASKTERVLMARRFFRYGGVELPAEDGRAQSTFAKDGRIVEIERDVDGETRAGARLRKFGFARLSDVRSYNLPKEYKFDATFTRYGSAWLDFIYRDAPALRAEGWEVEIESDFPVRLALGAGEVLADFREFPEEGGSGIDWFELDLGILVDGERVDLTPAILAAIGDPGFGMARQGEKNDAPIYLPLADGRTLALPRARLLPIVAALRELLKARGDKEAKRLGFSSLDAPGLAEFEEATAHAGLVWRGGERWRELGRMLRETCGIPRAQVPKTFAAELRPYQARGVDWLQFLRTAGVGGVLADDMGLGKTVQTLAHIAVEKESGRLDRPALVVAPTSLVANWRLEAERFAPLLKVLALHGPERKSRFGDIEKHDLVITTYPLLARDHAVLGAQPWGMLVLDEAQTIKNPDATTTRRVNQLDAQHRLCLTGTPLENHLGELWSLFTFLSPGFLGDRQSFNRSWRTPIEKHGDRERQLLLAKRVRPFLLRRTKAEVAAELPPMTEIAEPIEMEPAQRDLYESVRLAMHKKVRDAISKKGLARSRIVVLDALLKLRQVCCDPRLVKLETRTKAQSAKLVRLMEMLTELLDEGRRILLFSQFTSMLALIEEELRNAGVDYALLTGDTRDRATPIGRFQSGKVPLFLISLKAGGVGLNLTAADTVIHYDPWWNPAVEDQASDRAHRIGQDKPVFVHKLVMLDSIEEKMDALKARKRALAAGLFDPEAGGALDLTEADVEALFGIG